MPWEGVLNCLGGVLSIATRPKGSGKISGHYMVIIGNNTTSETE